MRSRTERALWTALAAALAAGAGAAWWTAGQWWPQAGPWAQQAWRKLTRPGPETLPPPAGGAHRAATPSPQGAASVAAPLPPRKCVRDGRTTYTDQPCPPGSQERAMDGGALMSLPSN